VLDTYLDRRESREGYKKEEERYNICRELDEEIVEIGENSSKDSSANRDVDIVESEGETAQQVF
jgi:hypothetical protein